MLKFFKDWRLFLLVLLALGMTRAAASAPLDPLTLYGPELRFDVYRNGEKAGRHTVRFERGDEGLRVEAAFNVAVRFLGFVLYEYRYDSRALWRGNRLMSLEAAIDDDGTRHSVTAKMNGEGLEVTGPHGRSLVSPGLFPTNHWNSAVIGSDRVFNTLTGKVNRVEIVGLGTGTVETENGRRPARHYRYTGELEAEVWYDSRSRWVKLRFRGKDNSIIDYVCQRCQGPAAIKASR